MKRETLFRGKSEKNNEWVYGYLVEGEFTYIISKEEFFNAVVTLSGHMSTFCEVVNPETIGQFIQEVNEQKIFVGDVVKAYRYGDLESEPFCHSIDYRSGTYWFGNWTWLEFLNIFRLVEVVGNIYDVKE